MGARKRPPARRGTRGRSLLGSSGSIARESGGLAPGGGPPCAGPAPRPGFAPSVGGRPACASLAAPAPAGRGSSGLGVPGAAPLRRGVPADAGLGPGPGLAARSRTRVLALLARCGHPWFSCSAAYRRPVRGAAAPAAARGEPAGEDGIGRERGVDKANWKNSDNSPASVRVPSASRVPPGATSRLQYPPGPSRADTPVNVLVVP